MQDRWRKAQVKAEVEVEEECPLSSRPWSFVSRGSRLRSRSRSFRPSPGGAQAGAKAEKPSFVLSSQVFVNEASSFNPQATSWTEPQTSEAEMKVKVEVEQERPS
jgi:hypothetical protein